MIHSIGCVISKIDSHATTTFNLSLKIVMYKGKSSGW